MKEMRRDTPSPSTQLYTFWMTPSPHQLRTYVIDGSNLNQNTYDNIPLS